MSSLELTNEIEAKAPSSDAFTPYDESHFAIYLSLLYASCEGMSMDDMSRSILASSRNVLIRLLKAISAVLAG
jgi:hypothetical protein